MSNQLNDVKRFLKRLVVLLFAIIIIDFVIGKILAHYYFKISSGMYYNTTFAIDSTNAETLVFGSSRANHHYVPLVFEKELETSLYNCGRDGVGLVFEASLIKAITSRYKPKRIIMDILPGEFTFDESESLTLLLPYQNKPAIYPYLAEISPFEPLKLLSRCYPYNSLISSIVIGNINKKPKEDDKGFVPLFGNIGNEPPRKTIESDTVLKKKVEVFDDIVNYLKDEGIICYFVISPDFAESQRVTGRLIKKKIGNAKNLHFVDYSHRSNYMHPGLFFNTFHLNYTGAVEFSEELCNYIKHSEQ